MDALRRDRPAAARARSTCRPTRYDGDDADGLEPALKPGLAGGWHYEGDAHLRPDRLMASWRRVLERRGVEIREDCELPRLRPATAARRGRS